jgi:hypothetical protein
VKLKLVSFLPALGPSIQRESAQAVADWAVQCEIEIPVDGLQVIAQAGTTPATIIQLLRSKVAAATADQLAALLSSMGQPYSDLAQRTSLTTVIPTNDENNELLRRLQKLGLVNRFRKLRLGRGTQVHTAASGE